MTSCVVDEGGVRRTFTVTLHPLAAATEAPGSAPSHGGAPGAGPAPAIPVAAESSRSIPVYSTFSGSVEVVDILVGMGDRVEAGMPVVAVEAMKARHEIRSPEAGRVEAIHIRLGSEVDRSQPLLTLR